MQRSPGCYSCDPTVDADRASCGRLAAGRQPHPGLSVPSAATSFVVLANGRR
jgi:hypothetical protein